MSNHFHILLEVPPMPEGGIPDAELFEQLGAFYSEAQVADLIHPPDAIIVKPERTDRSSTAPTTYTSAPRNSRLTTADDPDTLPA